MWIELRYLLKQIIKKFKLTWPKTLIYSYQTADGSIIIVSILYGIVKASKHLMGIYWSKKHLSLCSCPVLFDKQCKSECFWKLFEVVNKSLKFQGKMCLFKKLNHKNIRYWKLSKYKNIIHWSLNKPEAFI